MKVKELIETLKIFPDDMEITFDVDNIMPNKIYPMRLDGAKIELKEFPYNYVRVNFKMI